MTSKAISSVRSKFAALAICLSFVASGNCSDPESILRVALKSTAWASDLEDFDLEMIIRKSSSSARPKSPDGIFSQQIRLVRATVKEGSKFTVVSSQGGTNLIIRGTSESMTDGGWSEYAIGNGEGGKVTSLPANTTNVLNCPRPNRSCFHSALGGYVFSSLPLALYLSDENSEELVEELLESLAEVKPNDVDFKKELDERKQPIDVYRVTIHYPENGEVKRKTRCLRFTVGDGLLKEIHQGWIMGKHVSYTRDDQPDKGIETHSRMTWKKIEGRTLLQSIFVERSFTSQSKLLVNCTLNWKSFDKAKIELPDEAKCELLCKEQRKEIDKMLNR